MGHLLGVQAESTQNSILENKGNNAVWLYVSRTLGRFLVASHQLICL